MSKIILLALLVSLSFVLINLSDEQKSFHVSGTGFLFPDSFRVAEYAGNDVRIHFNVDGETLEQNQNSSFKKGGIAIQLMSIDKHPGSFYIREKSIDYTKCKYRKFQSRKVCSYTLTENNGKFISHINIILSQNDKMEIASICHASPPEMGMTTVCTAWSPYMGKFKIAYNYPEKFQEKIIQIDEHAKSIFKKAEMDFLNANRATQ